MQYQVPAGVNILFVAMVAYDISALMEYKGLSLKKPQRSYPEKNSSNLGGDGGIIAIDKNGNMAMEFNTAGMFRATMNEKGELYIGMYND